MQTFFKHENQHYLPSISEYGKLRSTKKSDLLSLLAQNNLNSPSESFDSIVFDGGALVHLLSTTSISTFDQYANEVIIPHILKQLQRCTRVDIVWDTYIADSIKASTKEKRGKGIRRKVAGKNKLQGKRNDFLRDETNKTELFYFLSERVSAEEFPQDKEVYITCGINVLSKGTDHLMQPCHHEEADTRLVVHLVDAVRVRHTNFLVRTVDTDVIVIIIGKFFYLSSLNPSLNIWVAFGKGKHFSYLHINSICTVLGKDKSLSLPVFHSFIGCDTTSGFFGKGKKIAWEAWKCNPQLTTAFADIAMHPFQPLDEDSVVFYLLERFVAIMYNKTSNLEHVDQARLELFCQRNRGMENLPPTSIL